MRFPIYTFDLTPKRRFKRIANVLRHHWPVANDISLMTSLEILARGLGYRDFHDVLQSSKVCLPDAPVSTLQEVRDNVSTSIFQFFKSCNVVGIDDSDIERLVMLFHCTNFWLSTASAKGKRLATVRNKVIVRKC